MKRPAYEVVLAAPADRDFLEIMDWSVEHFGAAAADRYQLLIAQALADIREDPFRPGAVNRPELPEGIYTYHLANSRERVAGGACIHQGTLCCIALWERVWRCCVCCTTAAIWHGMCRRHSQCQSSSPTTAF